MTKTLILLVVGLTLGYAVGFYHGKSVTDEDWSHRTVKGVAVDCYDSKGNLLPDEFAKKYGGFALSCAPGQTAKVHQAK